MESRWSSGPILAACGCLAAASLLGAAWYGAVARDSQLFGPSVFRGPGRRRSIALTFDDGPGPGSLELLDLLAAEDVKATFFVCGANVLRHPEIARRVVDAGHEIGNHTFTHPRLCPRVGWRINLRSPTFITREVVDTQDVIEEKAGVRPTLFRAPYGFRWLGLRAVQRSCGLLGVMWTVIGHDWEWSAEEVSAHVLSRATAGGIVCLHDGRDTRANPDVSATLAAVPKIIAELKRMGYRFETVTELLRPDEEAAR